MGEFYVYIHYRLSDGKPFYVGKGKGNRAHVKSGRNSRWTRTVNKHGLEVDILFENLNEDEAFLVERDCITELRYFGYDLCNMTDGGEGSSGVKMSIEARTKISETHKGRIKSEQERKNLSKALKGKTLTESCKAALLNANLGKKHSDETNRKRSEKLLEVGTCNDRNKYVFFSKEDVFVGTRKELSDYSGVKLSKFKTLFSKQQYKVVSGWSVLKLNELFLIKENINDYCN